MIESKTILQWYAAQRAEHQVIAYPRMFAEICDRNPTETLILSQLFFWSLPNSRTGKSKLKVFREGYHWLAKSNEEWADEVMVKPRSVRTAMSNLKRRGLIVTERFKWKGIPTTHIRINEAAVEDAIAICQNRQAGLTESSNGTDEIVDPLELTISSNPYTETTDDYPQMTTTTSQGEGGGDLGGGKSFDSSFQRQESAQPVAEYAGQVMKANGLKVATTKALVKACEGKSSAAAALCALAVVESACNGVEIRSPQAMLTRALQEWWAPSFDFFARCLTEGQGRLWCSEYAIAAQRLGLIEGLELGKDGYLCAVAGEIEGSFYTYSELPELESHMFSSPDLAVMWAEVRKLAVA